MKLTTQRDLIRTYPENFQQFYYPSTPERQWMYEKLLALDKEIASPQDIEAITGFIYPALYCSECLQYVTTIIEIGSDQDGNSVSICPDCLQKALALVQGEHQ